MHATRAATRQQHDRTSADCVGRDSVSYLKLLTGDMLLDVVEWAVAG
jgi:hypothetical protein